MKTKMICRGEYERTDGRNTVRVFYHECGGWMAAAEWDRFLYTDLLPTKRDAVFSADQMLAEADPK